MRREDEPVEMANDRRDNEGADCQGAIRLRLRFDDDDRVGTGRPVVRGGGEICALTPQPPLQRSPSIFIAGADFEMAGN